MRLTDEKTDVAEGGLEPDDLMVRGIVLMVLIKLVAMRWIGLDGDAWYVWPWTWVAFGLMVPALAGWASECREGWDD